MTDRSTKQNQTPLSEDATRRILLSLIADEQEKLIKKGAVSPDRALAAQSLGLTKAQIGQMAIDEDQLGFDSLSRLDLVLRVNRFFQLHSSGVDDYLLIRRTIGDWVDLVMQHHALCQGNVQFTFLTSGSTGEPKPITHDLEALQAEVYGLFAGPNPIIPTAGRIIALVPPHHIYGFLFSCLLPSLTGAKVISLYQQPPTRCLTLAQTGDVVIATPYLWDKLAQSGLRFAPGVHGVTSGAPATTTTWSAVEKAHLATMTEVYGATETGGVGFRTVPDDPFDLLPHLAVTEGQVHHDGLTCLRLDLQDRLHWTGARHFYVLGRLDDTVQVAGVNVSPQHVAREIAKITGVKSVDIRLRDDRLHALIVPSHPDDATEAIARRIREHLSQHLAAPARPATLTFRASRPCNDQGKLLDWTSS